MKKLKGILLLAALTLVFTGCGQAASKSGSTAGSAAGSTAGSATSSQEASKASSTASSTSQGDTQASANEMFQKAMEKIGKQTSLDNTVKMTVAVTANGETQNLVMDSKLLAEKTDSKDMKMMLDTTMTMSGATDKVKTVVYAADGYFYAEVDGVKVKMQKDLTELQQQLNSSSVIEIPDEALESMTSKTEGDKTTFTYKVKTDDPELTEFFKTLSASLAQGMEMTISDISGEAVINKDYDILSEKFEVTFAVKDNGKDGTMTLGMEVTNNKPGAAVTVELPDLSGYEEVSAEQK